MRILVLALAACLAGRTKFSALVESKILKKEKLVVGRERGEKDCKREREGESLVHV